MRYRPRSSPLALAAIVCLGGVGLAAAEASAEVDTAAAGAYELIAKKSADRRHLAVLEAFGKHGLYSLGYEYAVREWFSVGAAGAAFRASSRSVFGASAYVGFGIRLRGPHRLFAQLGPEAVRESEPAVPGFDGLTRYGFGAQGTGGYEYRGARWLFRVHALATLGRGGVAPWAGASVGVRF